MTLFDVVGGCLYDELGRVLIIKRHIAPRLKPESGKFQKEK